MTPAESFQAFVLSLFPPPLLTEGREIEVRVLRPERPTGTAADGAQKWTRPQMDRREWFSTADALLRWKPPSDRHVWIAGAARTGRDGTKAGVAASASLWVDIDEGGDEARDAALLELERRAIRPSLVVRSSPGKHHLWWRLDAPYVFSDAASRQVFEGRLAGLAALLKGDRACIDCSRVLRLPGTYNVKPWYEPPPAVEVLEVSPERVYSFDSFAGLPSPGRPLREPTRALAAPPISVGPVGSTEAGGIPSHPSFPYLDRCSYIQYVWANAETLAETLWSALAWTLAPAGAPGEALFLELSRPHSSFDAEEASERIRYARTRGYSPPSCRSLSEHGFTCPVMDVRTGCCTLAPVRSPAALIEQGPATPGTGFIRNGRTWKFNADAPPSLLADFTVRFTEELVLPEGTKRLKLEAQVPTGAVHGLELPAESLADTKDFLCRLAGAMGFDYRGLDPRNLTTARDAWQATSEIRRIRVSRDFGFQGDGSTFIGLDAEPTSSIRYEVASASASWLRLRSRPQQEVDETIFMLLDRWPQVACGELAARLMLGVAVWALVAPVLEGRGAGVSPLCAWLTGSSGLGKSTSATTIQCLFGDFADRGRVMSFGSTPYAIEDGAHDFRGALMVIDDAKESAIAAGNRASLLGVLQRLPDRTGRSRLRPDGTHQQARGSRTTALVNGEDLLFQEASIRARYFGIPATRAREQSDTALRTHDEIRRRASSVMASLVQALIDHPTLFETTYEAYVEERRRLDGHLPGGDNRPRVSASAAAILSGYRLFIDHAQSRSVIPSADAQLQMANLSNATTALASDQVIRTANLTPGERFLTDLRQLMAGEFARFDGVSPARSLGTRLGFAREDWIGVFPELAVARCNEILHKDGDRLPSAESVGASLEAIGALAGTGKGRIASRKGDPLTKQKQSVWLIKAERLLDGEAHEAL